MKEILGNPDLASSMAREIRKYAEETFEIENVVDLVEALFQQVVKNT